MSSDVLCSIERQLAGAAELHFSGMMNEELYISTVRGALAMLPMLKAPQHVSVLKRLKEWKDNDLLPLGVYEQLCPVVVAASRPPTAGAEGSSASTTVEQPVHSERTEVLPSAKKQKAAPALPAKQQTIFNVLPAGTTRTKVTSAELRMQRQAASRGEDYEPEEEELLRFRKERLPQPAPAVQKEYSCPQCPRKFSTLTGLQNHVKWHPLTTQPKEFFQRNPEVPPMPVEISLSVDADGTVAVGFTLDDRTLEEIKAEEAAGLAAQQERERARRAEAVRRQRIRDAEEEAERGEHRVGSKHRRSYTPKEKLRILEIWDKIRDDPTILKKVEAFESDPRAKGTPYTTVKVGWAPPLERAKIAAAAGRAHAGTLLRIDKTSRQKGKFAAMEVKWRSSSLTASRRDERAAARCPDDG